ncbi:type I restriction endonuclease [Clostridium perfringens]|uniref:type I restriction endonuclease n=1 Tax=Clostridium perfringens TaxID=1502 RepID=UPI001ABB8B5A|nr:type I restriction endonuclease [Clostridium perfringens]MBO3377290.1 type I restriction enzyme HsdR N-terminal domain-containing protein [Clostridium perfringens]MDK0619145.1 type I restriction enzyme HsdR N-terminal domain-containing protein [Clostridium perfringens]MDK0980328.1 type I restriction enzyme HsdR N-terminal domain-containing protein [Clostridium perfringens]MDM0464477.1 type I restriction enzyme HsdR N-terminal domain-containing protein [Clostridium perfringens]MDU3018987.1 t
MAFKDDIQKLSVQVKERKEYITNEEMTKQALIIPFIQILGFDVFNPIEIRPEYSADFGIKKGEKVDYALFKENEPIIFIEAKSVNENLNNHDAQLARYFNSTKEVKLAILTNGVEYKFFTDLNANNVMDDTPFLNINLLEIKESDIESLNKLRKENFDKDSLITYAEELVYTSTLNESLRRLFSNPSDDFVRFIVKDFSEMRITSNVIERFRPLVKKAISNAVLDIVSKGLYQQETLTIKKEENINNDSVNRDDLSEIEIGNKVHKGIITTENELKGFNIVKDILEKNNRDISEINYKDTTNYFSVYLRNTTRWIIRFNLDASKKNVMTKLPVEYAKNICLNKEIEQAPKGIGESRVYINSIDELYDLEKYLVDAYDNVN